MPFLAQIAITVIAVSHIGFMILEMFLWDKPIGTRIFGTEIAFAKRSKNLAANQGLYNGFLAAGLIWSLMPIGAPDATKAIATFFLTCVLSAGIFGARTVSIKILWVQALPALITLCLVWLLAV